MFSKKSVKDVDLKNKKVFVRVDFNVPVADGKVGDDKRIQAALPTINYLLEQNCAVVLASHLGRPKDAPSPEFSLLPVYERLKELLSDITVKFVEDCIGEKAAEAKKNLLNGEVLLLENLRFHPEEKKGDEDFAARLADGCGDFVCDAFGTVHRAHASMVGVAKKLNTKTAGFLVQKELKFLGEAVENPKRPFVAILGGAKVSGKIDVIKNLLPKVDKLLIGGGMMFTFYKAQGIEIGKSLLEEDKIELARELLNTAGEKLLLPVDVLVADKFDASADTKVVDIKEIPAGWLGVDVGPKTIELFGGILKDAKTVIWNGPLGVFEIEKFAKGTFKTAELLASIDAVTIIGGGDSASAVKKAGLSDKMTHISTGGGASIEFLEGKELPGIAVLDDN